MKSNILILSVLLSLLFILSSCKKTNVWGITGKGGNVSETKDISGFDRINLKTDADVVYTQDSTYFVEVTGQKNILSVLDLKNENGTLNIDFKRNVWKHNKLKITIHSPVIYAMSISGSGDIVGQNEINTSYMELGISGSGNIKLSGLTSAIFKARLSGSGNIRVDGGSVSSQNLSISGSGDMDLINLNSTSCSCKISGSGDMAVKVLEDLDVSISGSGDVKYNGFPRVNSRISGSGKLTHI